jgi:phenylalanyl-tRNA synthetase beta chain
VNISYNWLKEYINTDLPPREVAGILTNIGLEVDGIESLHSVKGGLEGVVIGEVLSCRKHPNADKLTLAEVDVGSGKPVQIVCGAPNVAAGQKVPVAIVGSTLYKGEEKFPIKKTKIRGEVSEGMICAEDELNLGPSHDGIMVLDPDARTGLPASEYFGIESDTVFSIDLTPNRIDAASHIGVARDLAAFLAQNDSVQLVRPSVDAFSVDSHDLPIEIRIEEKAGCRRYSGLTISGVTVKESPPWLQQRLRSIGLTPINNVVDITNFVLHETGQPLHAFDVARIRGRQVVVKTLPAGTRFTTLDGEERTLLGTDLMICNAEEGMCIAGVFGGIDSGVTEATADVFLESACFDPVYIRKTSRHHGLQTDASFRFERGSDPNITVLALKRAALLIREIAGGSISSEVVDVYPEPVEEALVKIRYDHINRLAGNEMNPETIRSVLESLEIRVTRADDDGMEVRVPTYRVDVTREADVIEEFLRIYGFNRVEVDGRLRSTLSYPEKPDREKAVNLVSEMLTANGFYEMKSNSLTRSAYYDRGGVQDPGAVHLFNPLSQDLAVMRKNLLYGGLEAVVSNTNRKQPDLKLYEFGYCYFQDPERNRERPLDRFHEQLHMGIFISGRSQQGNWIREARDSSFYELKSYVEMVLTRLGIDPYDLARRTDPHPDYAERMSYGTGDGTIVEFGRVAPVLLQRFDIRQEVFAAEFNWDGVMKTVAGKQITFRPLPRFHVVKRDLSLMLDREVTYNSLRSLAFNTEQKLLKEVSLFDVYEGDKIEKGKKSYALTFTLLDEEKTLTDALIDRTMLKIARAFEKEFGAVIRGMEQS